MPLNPVPTEENSLVIEIGENPIELRTTDPALRILLKKRYAPFLSAKKPSARFKIELVEVTAIRDVDEDLCVRLEDEQWKLSRGDFQAVWNPRTREGCIRQSLNPYSPDAVLRIVHSLMLATEGGFLVHSASAIRGGRAFLFAGISGAGKTTISRLAPGDAVLLTDEISYVKRDGDRYRAFGTPFAGELAELGNNASAQISTLFFLEKGPENRIDKISAEAAVARLLRNILFFANDPSLVESVFQSACKFVESVPVKKLVFLPEKRIWDTIAGN